MCGVVQLETMFCKAVFLKIQFFYFYFLNHSSHSNNRFFAAADYVSFLVAANFKPSLLICMNNYNTANATLLPLLL